MVVEWRVTGKLDGDQKLRGRRGWSVLAEKFILYKEEGLLWDKKIIKMTIGP